MQQHEDRRIVILTGAGISKESGLDTFRDPDGIWSRVSIEDVATPEAFERDPARVHAIVPGDAARVLASLSAPDGSTQAPLGHAVAARG